MDTVLLPVAHADAAHRHHPRRVVLQALTVLRRSLLDVCCDRLHLRMRVDGVICRSQTGHIFATTLSAAAGIAASAAVISTRRSACLRFGASCLLSNTHNQASKS